MLVRALFGGSLTRRSEALWQKPGQALFGGTQTRSSEALANAGKGLVRRESNPPLRGTVAKPGTGPVRWNSNPQFGHCSQCRALTGFQRRCGQQAAVVSDSSSRC
jgi:hypothetical protein